MSKPFTNSPGVFGGPIGGGGVQNPIPPSQQKPAGSLLLNNGTITLGTQTAFNSPTGGIWNDYVCRQRYESDKHTYMAGITSPGGFQSASVAFFRLANTTLLRIVDWTAYKTGTQPEIPSSIPLDTNWVILDEFYEPAEVTIPADGSQPCYRISGTYIYGHKNPAAVVVNNINYARPPWVQDIFDRTMPTSKLQQNLADGTGTGQVVVTPKGIGG